MNIIDIISKKKHNKKLTEKEIEYCIENYVDKKIPDYQMAALLMAIRLNGMDDNETVYLTKSMLNSGQTIKYKNMNKKVVDKHSTGGVGDKTSLVLIPLLASLGYAVSKMSGRGLGHTGGTVDKLESFEGFDIERTHEEIEEQVGKIGCAIVGQSKDIVPADKLLYALRDVTSTVDSIPLIASSIMSKKLALGADIILLDVKYGNGAFMKDKESARELANKMIQIGKFMDKKVLVSITNMNQPLGSAIGNSLEVEEAIDTLKNEGNKELLNLCVELASLYLIVDKGMSKEGAEKEVLSKIKSKEAYEKFLELLKYQGVSNFNLKKAKNKKEIILKEEGYVKDLLAKEIGRAAMKLGAGREVKEDHIDLSVGIKLHKKIGDYVNKDKIATIYYNDDKNLNEVIDIIKSSYTIVKEEVKKPSLIEEILK